MAQLQLYPRDPYLQYVALQLARREGRLDLAGAVVGSAIAREGWDDSRRNRVDLFDLFTGALAVQESLQLDTMLGGQTPAAVTRPEPLTPSPQGRGARAQPGGPPKPVAVTTLAGPAVKSHPWKKMLAGRKPEVSRLSRLVPEDFYLVEFRSLNKLVDFADQGDLWGTHFLSQAFREARSHQVGGRLKRQLALETDPALRPFYDLVVEEVAVTGSDLFIREGSDVTVLFQFKLPEVFKPRLDELLARAEKSRPDATRSAGSYLGVEYTHLQTPDRDLSVLTAYPAPGLCVRSNSKAAFERVLEAIRGKTAAGRPVKRLGDSDEFAYIRTLMPQGAPEEDGLVYLSDPFIRRLVGAQLKLTERRRLLCYNHLRMIGHASLLYRTERGRPPESLPALAEARCAPGLFGAGDLACPGGGGYTLSSDGAAGVCSRHGRTGFLTPALEIPVGEVSREEAELYAAFREDYDRYWRTFFDPIAVRIQTTPEQYRLETIILPLIDNSIYTGLARALAGPPGPLDARPVPQRNIFSLALRLNKEALLSDAASLGQNYNLSGMLRDLGFPDYEAAKLNVAEFVAKGLGGPVGVHIYDAPPTFDFNVPSLLGQTLGRSDGNLLRFGTTELVIGLALLSINAPVYLSLPVQDQQVVDRFLNQLDLLLAAGTRQPRRDRFGFDFDYYQLPMPGGAAARGFGLRFEPLKLRLFWQQIGDTLYLASKPFILDDLNAAEAERAKSGSVQPASPQPAGQAQPAGHAMVRVRAENWRQVLPDFRLGWAESNREACLNNLGLLSSVGRAFAAEAGTGTGGPVRSGEELGREVHKAADRLQGAHLFCPEGGLYVLVPGANINLVTCSVHGSALKPQQPAAPAGGDSLGRLMQDLNDLTATLTFLEDGLHAVLVIRRK